MTDIQSLMVPVTGKHVEVFIEIVLVGLVTSGVLGQGTELENSGVPKYRKKVFRCETDEYDFPKGRGRRT
jgi:hypothetical protein